MVENDYQVVEQHSSLKVIDNNQQPNLDIAIVTTEPPKEAEEKPKK